MCVVNKQLELLEYVFEPVYVDLQYDEIYLTFTAGSVCLCGVCIPAVVHGLSARLRVTLSCGCGCCGDRDACTAVCVACVYAAKMSWCEDDGNVSVGSGGGVVAVSAYMAGTRGSGVLSSAGDVPETSVVRCAGGVCDMCKCLARGGVGGVGGEWVTGLGLGLTNSGGTWGEMGYVSVFWLRWCGWCWGIVGGWLGPCGVKYVCVVSLDPLC